MTTFATYRPIDIYSSAAKYDPTKTTALRNQFVRDMDRRFTKIERAIYDKIVVEDCFNLNPSPLATHEQFLFPRSSDKVAAFMEWLQKQVDAGILSVSEYQQLGDAIDSAWTNLYITDSYKRGVIRARYELQQAGYTNIPSTDATGGISVSMMVPVHLNRLGLLYTRVYTDLKGITEAMDAIISRILTQGIADGDNPRLLARKLLSAINGTGMGDLGITDSVGRFIPAKRRAEMLARTEIIRAHHQATIQEYMNWGVWNVNVMAEFMTAHDNRVCDKCHALTLRNPYTLEEAMNLIPVHPNCRCICLPFEVGVDTLIPQ